MIERSLSILYLTGWEVARNDNLSIEWVRWQLLNNNNYMAAQHMLLKIP